MQPLYLLLTLLDVPPDSPLTPPQETLTVLCNNIMVIVSNVCFQNLLVVINVIFQAKANHVPLCLINIKTFPRDFV